jgi:hypothetical protein
MAQRYDTCLHKVKKFLATGAKNVNGWNIGSFFGDRAFYSGNWLLRASAASYGIYGNDAVEAMYPYTPHGCDGRNARRQQAQLHDHLSGRTTPSSELFLVGDDV